MYDDGIYTSTGYSTQVCHHTRLTMRTCLACFFQKYDDNVTEPFLYLIWWTYPLNAVVLVSP